MTRYVDAFAHIVQSYCVRLASVGVLPFECRHGLLCACVPFLLPKGPNIASAIHSWQWKICSKKKTKNKYDWPMCDDSDRNCLTTVLSLFISLANWVISLLFNFSRILILFDWCDFSYELPAFSHRISFLFVVFIISYVCLCFFFRFVCSHIFFVYSIWYFHFPLFLSILLLYFLSY